MMMIEPRWRPADFSAVVRLRFVAVVALLLCSVSEVAWWSALYRVSTMISIAASARDVPCLIRDGVSKQVNAIVACNSFKMSSVTFIKHFGRVFFDLAMAVDFALGFQI